MAEKLVKTASGMRHLRWARQIQANLHAHEEHNYLLSQNQKAALAAEGQKLDGLVTALAGAVAPYRAFLEEAYVNVRACQTVADFLCDEAQREAHGRATPYRKEIGEVFKAQGGFAALLSHKPLSRVLNSGRETTETMARAAGTLLAAVPKTIFDASALSAALIKAADSLKGFIAQEKDVIEPKRMPLKVAMNTAVYNLREGLEQMDGRLRSHFSDRFIDSLYPELKKGGGAVAGDEEEDDDAAGAAAQGG